MLHRRQGVLKPIKPWQGPKPKLKMGVMYLCRVRYLDLQAYLAKVYRMHDYDILKSEGIVGVFPEYLVTGKMPDAHNSTQQANDIRRGRKIRNLGLILNVLCADGFIPQGKYVIDTRVPHSLIATYTQLLNTHRNPKHPECMAFKKTYDPNPDFKRRARGLDRIAKSFYENDAEKPNERA